MIQDKELRLAVYNMTWRCLKKAWPEAEKLECDRDYAVRVRIPDRGEFRIANLADGGWLVERIEGGLLYSDELANEVKERLP